jgi:hypothetical protein
MRRWSFSGIAIPTRPAKIASSENSHFESFRISERKGVFLVDVGAILRSECRKG